MEKCSIENVRLDVCLKESAFEQALISVIRINTCCWTCWTPQKMQKQNMFIINNLCEIYGLLCIHWVIQSFSQGLFPPSPFLLHTGCFFPLTSFFLSLHQRAVMPEDMRQRAAPPSGAESSWMQKADKVRVKRVCLWLIRSFLRYATGACSLCSSLFFMLIQATTSCCLMTYLCIHTHKKSVVQRLKKCLNAYWNIKLLCVSPPQHT